MSDGQSDRRKDKQCPKNISWLLAGENKILSVEMLLRLDGISSDQKGKQVFMFSTSIIKETRKE